jgi:uncharacterized protein
MSKQNVQAASGLYDAFNRGDLDALEQGFSPVFTWNEAENSLYAAGNPYRSFPALREGVFTPTSRDFDPFRCDVEQLLDAGDHVVATGRYRGKCKATGKTMATQFCHIMHVDGAGKVDSIQEYADTLDEAQVTGRTQPVEELRIPHPAM